MEVMAVKTKRGVMMRTVGEWRGYGVEITLYQDGLLKVLVYDHTIPPRFALAMTASVKWEIYNPHALPLPPLDRTMVDYWGWEKLTDWLKQNGTAVEVFLE